MTAFLRLFACVALVLLGSPVSAAVLYAIADPDDDDSDIDEDDDPDDLYRALAHPPTGDSDDTDEWPIPADTGGEANATVRKATEDKRR